MKRLEEHIPNLNDRLYPKNTPKKRYSTENLPTYKLNLSKKKTVFDINNAYRNPIIEKETKSKFNGLVSYQNSTDIKKFQNFNPIPKKLRVQLPVKTIGEEKQDVPTQSQHLTIETQIGSTPKIETHKVVNESMGDEPSTSKYSFMKWNFNRTTQIKNDSADNSKSENSSTNNQKVNINATPMELDEEMEPNPNWDIKNSQSHSSPSEMKTDSPLTSQLFENNNSLEMLRLEKRTEHRDRESERVNECVTTESAKNDQSQNEENTNCKDHLKNVCTQYVTDLPHGQKGTLSNDSLIELMLLQLNCKPVVYIKTLNGDNHLSCPTTQNRISQNNPTPSTVNDNENKTSRVSFVKASSLKRKSQNDNFQANDLSKKPLVSILKKSKRERTFYSKQSLCTPKVNVTRLDLNELLRLSLCSRNGPIYNVADVYNRLKSFQERNTDESTKSLPTMQEQLDHSLIDLDLQNSSLPVDKYKQLLKQTSSSASVNNSVRSGLVEMCYYKDNGPRKNCTVTFNNSQPSTSFSSRAIGDAPSDQSNQIENQSVQQDMMPLVSTNAWNDFTTHVTSRTRYAKGTLKKSPVLNHVDLDSTSSTKFSSPLRNTSIDLDDPENVKSSSSDNRDVDDLLKLITPKEIARAHKELSMDCTSPVDETIPTNFPHPYLGSDPNPLMHIESIINSQANQSMKQLLEEEMKRKSYLAQLLEVCKPDSRTNTTLQYDSETPGSNIQNPLVDLWDGFQYVDIKSEPQFNPYAESDDD